MAVAKSSTIAKQNQKLSEDRVFALAIMMPVMIVASIIT
jgi:hypothetical protein